VNNESDNLVDSSCRYEILETTKDTLTAAQAGQRSITIPSSGFLGWDPSAECHVCNAKDQDVVIWDQCVKDFCRSEHALNAMWLGCPFERACGRIPLYGECIDDGDC
jgi:hypothetical protein